MSSDPEYNPQRRIRPTPRLDRVTSFDPLEKGEQTRLKNIAAALERNRPKKKFELKVPPPAKK